MHAALEAGIVCFDTAPLYGDSEDRLGHGLRASPLGSSAQVITKAGKLLRHKDRLDTPVDWSPFAIPAEERERLPDYSRAGARRSFEPWGSGRPLFDMGHEPGAKYNAKN